MEQLKDIIKYLEDKKINVENVRKKWKGKSKPLCNFYDGKLEIIDEVLPRLKSIAEQQKDGLSFITKEAQELNLGYGEFQLCPKCLGQGVVGFPPYAVPDSTPLSTSAVFQCDVCNGQKVIAKPIHQPLNK